jgi:general secretion pathway protein K
MTSALSPRDTARSIARCRQGGAALLTAMLTVALVATFAAAALWQQWRSIEVETAERARVQSEWVLTGALDWARLMLREDAKSGGADHLGEPWAVPLQEARLSSFLAAERNIVNVDNAPVLDAFLSGQIVDLQSLLNVNNLVDATGKVSDKGFRSFARLFELMGLPPAQLDRLVENLRFATDASTNNRSSAAAPLVPQHVEQLVWLGIPVQTVAVLQPFVTVLPVHDTTVNLNTAGAEVIYAAVDGLSLADAQNLVTSRESAHYKSVSDAKKRINAADATFAEGQAPVNVSSRFFEARARLRLEALVVEERSVLQRDGVEVKVLARERGVPDLTKLTQQAPMR